MRFPSFILSPRVQLVAAIAMLFFYAREEGQVVFAAMWLVAFVCNVLLLIVGDDQ